MFDLIIYAIPFFVATLVVEWLQFRHDTEERRAELVGFGTNDTMTSLAMGSATWSPTPPGKSWSSPPTPGSTS
jgi:hypothetical protein